ncbi:MAG: bifunctional 5,10-methylenetetrahydrofolate dehydrogenase/5,10-methenyltetrahydrofolate cyclohydrolase, partial [Candidatus Omnitrophica bacterium]|nr:bifunctional 5,10-methylenetetrahydrofolate dehydrogenase/5,10-methenyltetrahydrofolate cyclohydrolase [Candidatus Omnitrophota bacterium]
MPAKLLEGKPIAESIKNKLKQDIAGLGFKPVLASILVGENAASEAYARSQEKIAAALGIGYQLHKLDAKIKQHELIAYVQKLNADKNVTGIII